MGGMNSYQREIKLWLAGELEKRGRGSKLALAKHLKVRPDVITRILNIGTSKEAREVGADELVKMQEFFGSAPPFDSTDRPIIVPIVAWISAGRLRRDVTDAQLGTYPMANLPKGDWIALKVDGDSMDRISPPGSVILVNRKDRTLVPNGCYVIDDGEGNATYKRYRPNPRRFEPVSTNKDLEPLYPEGDPTVIGRVRRTILEM